MSAQRCGVGRVIGTLGGILALDQRRDPFAEAIVRQSEDDGVANTANGPDHILDFTRVDIRAPPNDHQFATSCHANPAAVVNESKVAGMQRADRGFDATVDPVTEHGGIATRPRAGHRGRYCQLTIHTADIEMGNDNPARPWPPLIIRRVDRHYCGSFGKPVRISHRHSELGLELRPYCLGKIGSAAPDISETSELGRFDVVVAHHIPQLRRDRIPYRYPLIANPFGDPRRVASVHKHAAPAGLVPIRGLGEFFAMTVETLALIARRRFAWREFVRQSWFVARVS